MADLLFHHTQEGGELDLVEGAATEDDTLSTALYLSLLGGNEDDDGSDATERYQYWGNRITNDPDRWLRSSFQNVSLRAPLTSRTRVQIEQAAVNDASWMQRQGIVDSIEARATVHVNRVDLVVEVGVGGTVQSSSYKVNR